MYWPMLLWQQYLFSGDETLLREMAPRPDAFPGMAQALSEPDDQAAQSSLAGGFRSMPAATCPAAVTTSPRPANTMKTCASPPASFQRWGKRTKATNICARRKKSKPASTANLFNGEYYLARTDRKEMFPLASAWALRFDLVPAAAKSKVLAAILKRGKTKHRRLRRRCVL